MNYFDKFNYLSSILFDAPVFGAIGTTPAKIRTQETAAAATTPQIVELVQEKDSGDDVTSLYPTRALLVVMHGLVGAGKSTLCRKILSKSRFADVVPKTETGGPHRIHLWHVSYDQVVDGLSEGTDSFDLNVWKRARQKIFQFVCKTIRQSQDCVSSSNSSSSSSSNVNCERSFRAAVREDAAESNSSDVLKGISRTTLAADGDTCDVMRKGDNHIIFLDDNMYYRSMRMSFHKLCRQKSVEAAFAQIHVVVPADVAAKRNAARERPIPDVVMERLAALAESPNPEANRWEQHTLRVPSNSSSDVVASDVWPALRRAWKNPPKPFASQEEIAAIAAKAAEEREKTMKNVMHSLDKMLRKRVGLAMQATSSDGVGKTGRAARAKRLNALRKTLMADMRKALTEDPERAAIALQAYVGNFDRLSSRS